MAVRISPSRQFRRLELLERGEVAARRVWALVANLPRHIGERECRTIAEKTGWDQSCFTVEETVSRGPGNAVMITLEAAHVTEVFTGFGQLGVKAEEVAMQALREAREYLAAGVPVGKHLADQLMLPLAIGVHLGTGGGVFRTMPLTRHSTTHLEVIRDFLGVEAQVSEEEDKACVIRLG